MDKTANPYFQGETLDDVMRLAIAQILSDGECIHPTKGSARELLGVVLEITNPLARISRTEKKGTLFSCLGELCWYLAKTNKLEFISYYLPAYKSYADGNEIFGGYGPRLFDWRGINQFENIADILRSKPDSRQAVIQLFDAQDLVADHNDIPCTCTLQFMLRRGQLHMFTYMRSNDAYVGFPHDVFCFTMLQEIMARKLSVDLGTYKHAVGSLHLYNQSFRNARLFLNEGWQPTETLMPAMPEGDPRPAVQHLVEAEQVIRTRQELDASLLDNLHPYWADLVRLLWVFRSWKNKDVDGIRNLRTSMSSAIYYPFIDRRIK